MSGDKEIYLVGDIGGTHTRLGLITGNGSLSSVTVMENNEFSNIAEAIEAYINNFELARRPRGGLLAVACPVQGDTIRFTNSDWNFSVTGLKNRLSFSFLEVINDFSAIAMAVPVLEDEDVIKIGGGEPVSDKPVGIIGPGTGLGTAILIPVNGDWLPVNSEGGHVTLAAADERENQLISIIRQQSGHVSAERLLSGPGLTVIYNALLHIKGRERVRIDPVVITERDGKNEDPVASETLDLFMAMLGTVAGNLALTVGAEGGIYLAGGILPGMGERLLKSRFRQRFTEKGRFCGYLEKIPVYLITKEYVALYGLNQKLAGR